MGIHRKYDKPFYLRWPGKGPLKYIWMLYNPFNIVNKQHIIIADILKKRKHKKISITERSRRSQAGEGPKKCFKATLTRSMDFSGKSD
jgi:hypothetical protein